MSGLSLNTKNRGDSGLRHSVKVNYSNNGQICMALKEYYRAEPLLSPYCFGTIIYGRVPKVSSR